MALRNAADGSIATGWTRSRLAGGSGRQPRPAPARSRPSTTPSARCPGPGMWSSTARIATAPTPRNQRTIRSRCSSMPKRWTGSRSTGYNRTATAFCADCTNRHETACPGGPPGRPARVDHSATQRVPQPRRRPRSSGDLNRGLGKRAPRTGQLGAEPAPPRPHHLDRPADWHVAHDLAASASARPTPPHTMGAAVNSIGTRRPPPADRPAPTTRWSGTLKIMLATRSEPVCPEHCSWFLLVWLSRQHPSQPRAAYVSKTQPRPYHRANRVEPLEA